MYINKVKSLLIFCSLSLSLLNIESVPNSVTSTNENSTRSETNEIEVTSNLKDDNEYQISKDHFWSDEEFASKELSGDGSKENPYLISSGADWGYFTNFANNKGLSGDKVDYFSITKDLSLNGYEYYNDTAVQMKCFEIINLYRIVLNGNKHNVFMKVADDYINNDGNYGIFSYVSHSTIIDTNFNVVSFDDYTGLTDFNKNTNTLNFGALAGYFSYSFTYGVNVTLDGSKDDDKSLVLTSDLASDNSSINEMNIGSMFGVFDVSTMLYTYYTNNDIVIDVNTYSYNNNMNIGGLCGYIITTEEKADVIIEVENEPTTYNFNFLASGESTNNYFYYGLIYGNKNVDLTRPSFYILDCVFYGNNITINKGSDFTGKVTSTYAYLGYLDEKDTTFIYLSFALGYNLSNFKYSDESIKSSDSVNIYFDNDDYRNVVDLYYLGYDSKADYEANKIADYKRVFYANTNKMINPVLETVTTPSIYFDNIIDYMNCMLIESDWYGLSLYGGIGKGEYVNYSKTTFHPFKEYINVKGESSFSNDYVTMNVSLMKTTIYDNKEHYVVVDTEYVSRNSDGKYVHNPQDPEVEGLSVDYYIVYKMRISFYKDEIFNKNTDYKTRSLFLLIVFRTSTTAEEAAKYSYKLNYETNGGEIVDLRYKTKYKKSERVTLPTNVYKEGYIFVGWYLSSTLDKGKVMELSPFARGEYTFYAKWVDASTVEEGKYLASIYISGRPDLSNIAQIEEGSFVFLGALTQEGYKFLGYRDNPYGEGNIFSIFIMPDHTYSKVFYPVWSKI